MKWLAILVSALLMAGTARATTIMETADPAYTTDSLYINGTFISISASYVLPTPVTLAGDDLFVDIRLPTPLDFTFFEGNIPLNDSDLPIEQTVDSRGHGNGALFSVSYLNAIGTFIAPRDYAYSITDLYEYFFLQEYNPGDPPSFTLSGRFDVTLTTPEPSAWVLMLVGMGLLGASLRWRRVTMDIVSLQRNKLGRDA